MALAPVVGSIPTGYQYNNICPHYCNSLWISDCYWIPSVTFLWDRWGGAFQWKRPVQQLNVDPALLTQCVSRLLGRLLCVLCALCVAINPTHGQVRWCSFYYSGNNGLVKQTGLWSKVVHYLVRWFSNLSLGTHRCFAILLSPNGSPWWFSESGVVSREPLM